MMRMNKQSILVLAVSSLLIVGCQGTSRVTQEESTAINSSPSPVITETKIQHTPTINTSSPNNTATLSITKTPTTELITPTITSVATQEGKINIQCLDIDPSFTGDISSSGIVVLGRGVGDKQRKTETILLDMDSSQKTELTTQDELQFDHTTSPDRKQIANQNVIFDTNGTFVKYELVIADANGNRLKTIPWEEKWGSILEWTADRRLLLSYDEPYSASSDGHEIPVSYLVLDPFTGEQELLQPDVPGFLDIHPPSWMYWDAGIYDPTLTRMIYPQLLPDDEEMYSLTLWDTTQERQVISLEDIYANFLVFPKTTPLPRWSPDGSQFAFKGQVLVSEELVAFELYRVSRDGEIEQLTNLTSIADIDSYSFSWSPDNQRIAMIIDDWGSNNNTHLAVLDVKTHNITDYCVPIRGINTLYPIWSPDGTQLLVMDDEGDHRRVILVDIVKNYAAQIAEDYDPLGWMVEP